MKPGITVVLNVVIAVAALLFNWFAYPIGSGNWLLGIPLPYVVFETATGGGLLPFSSPISPFLFLINLAVCFVAMSAIRRLILGRCRCLNRTETPQNQEG